MKNGTAIGLLVGGAVLLVAAQKNRAVAVAAGAQPRTGGALNPFNWLGVDYTGAPTAGYSPQGYAGSMPNQIQPPAWSAGQQYINYTPSQTPNGYQYGGFSPSLAYDGGGFQNANYYPGQSPGGYQYAGYSPSLASDNGSPWSGLSPVTVTPMISAFNRLLSA